MATLSIIQTNLNRLAFTPARTAFVKKDASNVADTFKQSSELTKKLLELRNTHFNSFSLKDRILIKLGLKKDISPNMAILDHIGVEPIKLADENAISIDSYGSIEQAKLKKLGIKECDALKHVTVIRKNASFSDSELTDLQNIKSVWNNLYLGNSNIKNVDSLKSVGRHVYLNDNLSKQNFKNTCVHGCILP